MEEFLGPHSEYNEEEEERKYYRRKRLGVIKNVVAASVGAMIVYSVYMGEWMERRLLEKLRLSCRLSAVLIRSPQVFFRCSSCSIMTRPTER